jgi:hypothetical protein
MITPVLEEPIGTIDVWTLRAQARWPILRALTHRFVEQIDLRHYTRELLASGAWSVIRVEPHLEAGTPSTHVFDVFGIRYVPSIMRR